LRKKGVSVPLSPQRGEEVRCHFRRSRLPCSLSWVRIKIKMSGEISEKSSMLKKPAHTSSPRREEGVSRHFEKKMSEPLFPAP
jgi:hypothetical protein